MSEKRMWVESHVSEEEMGGVSSVKRMWVESHVSAEDMGGVLLLNRMCSTRVTKSHPSYMYIHTYRRSGYDRVDSSPRV